MSEWQPIDTAPKGGGADDVRSPSYVKPPRILLRFRDDEMSVGYWDWYYAEGGDGYQGDGHLAWIEPVSGEQLTRHYSYPTHWMPLPDPPVSWRLGTT